MFPGPLAYSLAFLALDELHPSVAHRDLEIGLAEMPNEVVHRLAERVAASEPVDCVLRLFHLILIKTRNNPVTLPGIARKLYLLQPDECLRLGAVLELPALPSVSLAPALHQVGVPLEPVLALGDLPKGEGEISRRVRCRPAGLFGGVSGPFLFRWHGAIVLHLGRGSKRLLHGSLHG